jgi:hypothetical protein
VAGEQTVTTKKPQKKYIVFSAGENGEVYVDLVLATTVGMAKRKVTCARSTHATVSHADLLWDHVRHLERELNKPYPYWGIDDKPRKPS